MLAIARLFSLLSQGLAQQTIINQIPIKRTSWASGKAMYQEYCAACHGKNADGQGPAAPAFKVEPSDLTALARRNGGKFPYDHFYAVLQFGTATLAHGSKDMPVWAPLFSSLDRDREAVVDQRLHNLASYVASRQAK